jgi:hypothetical protein
MSFSFFSNCWILIVYFSMQDNDVEDNLLIQIFLHKKLVTIVDPLFLFMQG